MKACCAIHGEVQAGGRFCPVCGAKCVFQPDGGKKFRKPILIIGVCVGLALVGVAIKVGYDTNARARVDRIKRTMDSEWRGIYDKAAALDGNQIRLQYILDAMNRDRSNLLPLETEQRAIFVELIHEEPGLSRSAVEHQRSMLAQVLVDFSTNR